LSRADKKALRFSSIINLAANVTYIDKHKFDPAENVASIDKYKSDFGE
jgi:hypothetical protein